MKSLIKENPNTDTSPGTLTATNIFRYIQTWLNLENTTSFQLRNSITS